MAAFGYHAPRERERGCPRRSRVAQCFQLLQLPRRTAYDRSARLENPEPATTMIGTELEGRYRIEAELGAGGVGSVYRGLHLKLGRTVAIKVLKPEYGASPELRQRFEREARALATLSHPNIVAVTDSGVAGDTPYLVMELLQGETLADRVRRGPLDPDEAFRIAADLVAALGFVHDHGLVHRDVKPGNVFLQNVGTGPALVRLLDFGLAKFVAPDAGGRAITRAGQVFGTPTYMAPEQVAGQDADVRADVYAVGIILFEMLAGKAPFRGNLTEVMRQHLMEELPLLESVNPERAASPELAALLKRATEKTRAERFANARALGDALAALPEPKVLVPLPHSELGNAATKLDPFSARTRVEGAPSGPAATEPAPSSGERPVPASASSNPPEASAKGSDAPLPDGVVPWTPPVEPPFERWKGNAVRIGLGLLVLASLTALLGAVAAVYVLVTPERTAERRELDQILHFSPAGPTKKMGAPSSSTHAAPSPSTPTSRTGARPTPTNSTMGVASSPLPVNSDAPALGNAAPTESPTTETIPLPAPSPSPPETASSPLGAPLPATTPVAPGARAPQDPWISIPRDLAKSLAKVNRGRGLDRKEILAAHRYNAKHGDDPRGHLLLARAYTNRKWLKDAVSEYAIADKMSPDARADPRMLKDLVTIVEFGSADAERLVVDVYGATAIPAVERALNAAQETPDVRERLQRLRAAL
jgi:serine/threonine-protein kinase